MASVLISRIVVGRTCMCTGAVMPVRSYSTLIRPVLCNGGNVGSPLWNFRPNRMRCIPQMRGIQIRSLKGGMSTDNFSYTAPPVLDNVMKLEHITDKSATEIAEIWKEYHSMKDSVCAVIPSDIYIELHAKSSIYPMFLYPLPRDEGYEFILGQFNGHRVYFTSLLGYQLYKENAPVSLTLTHYTDLQQSKGIVLMCGELDTKTLKPLDAQFLANQVQLYYAGSDTERLHLLRQFNVEPDKFNYEMLIEQLQNTSTSSSSLAQ